MKNTELWEGMNLTQLLGEIYGKTNDRREIILGLIKDLRDTMAITGQIDSVVMLAPIIKEYLGILGQSDEHFVKIATIVQRIISAESFQGGKSGDLNDILSDTEKDALMVEVKKDQAEAKKELQSTLLEIEKELSVPVPAPKYMKGLSSGSKP